MLVPPPDHSSDAVDLPVLSPPLSSQPNTLWTRGVGGGEACRVARFPARARCFPERLRTRSTRERTTSVPGREGRKLRVITLDEGCAPRVRRASDASREGATRPRPFTLLIGGVGPRRVGNRTLRRPRFPASHSVPIHSGRGAPPRFRPAVSLWTRGVPSLGRPSRSSALRWPAVSLGTDSIGYEVDMRWRKRDVPRSGQFTLWAGRANR